MNPVFSEITLSNGDRSIIVHVWSNGTVRIPPQPVSHWPSGAVSRATVRRWIRLGRYGDISEEPPFVAQVFNRIGGKKP